MPPDHDLTLPASTIYVVDTGHHEQVVAFVRPPADWTRPEVEQLIQVRGHTLLAVGDMQVLDDPIQALFPDYLDSRDLASLGPPWRTEIGDMPATWRESTLTRSLPRPLLRKLVEAFDTAGLWGVVRRYGEEGAGATEQRDAVIPWTRPPLPPEESST